MALILDGSGTITGATTLASTVASPVFTAPALGTPASGALTSCTSIPAAQLTGTVAVANGGTGVTAQSYVRLNTANGYGSTNTKIRRFTTIVDSAGSDITYADSATLGATFTINTAGVYSVSYTDMFSSTSWMGVSINSTQLTTNINSTTVATVLCVNTVTADWSTSVSAPFYAAATSVIRAHTTGVSTGAAAQPIFTITRVA